MNDDVDDCWEQDRHEPHVKYVDVHILSACLQRQVNMYCHDRMQRFLAPVMASSHGLLLSLLHSFDINSQET